MKLFRKEKARNREIWNMHVYLQKQAALEASPETRPFSKKPSVELSSPQIKQKSKAIKSLSLSSGSTIPTPKLLFNNKSFSPQGAVMKITVYEKRLAIYTNWSYNKLSAANMAAAGWCFEVDPVLLDHVRCPSCYAVKWDWSEIEDPLQEHLELQCKACPVAQALARAATKVLAKPAPSVAPEFSKLSKLKSPKYEVSTISPDLYSSTNMSQSKVLLVADSELQPKPIWFEIERFISTSPCSVSMKPSFELDTQLAVVLVANSSLMETYEERLATFKVWLYTSPTLEVLATAGFSYEIGIDDLTTCSECGLALANWKPKRNPLKAHLR